MHVPEVCTELNPIETLRGQIRTMLIWTALCSKLRLCLWYARPTNQLASINQPTQTTLLNPYRSAPEIWLRHFCAFAWAQDAGTPFRSTLNKTHSCCYIAHFHKRCSGDALTAPPASQYVATQPLLCRSLISQEHTSAQINKAADEL